MIMRATPRMSLWEIGMRPTSVTEIPKDCVGVHESTLRAYAILQQVKHWLKEGVPAHIILELIADIEIMEAFERGRDHADD
jgi:hypothetical protein